jgi:hypothetical protein
MYASLLAVCCVLLTQDAKAPNQFANAAERILNEPACMFDDAKIDQAVR